MTETANNENLFVWALNKAKTWLGFATTGTSTFMAKTWIWLPEGHPSKKFIDALVEQQREILYQRYGHADQVQPVETPVEPIP